MAADHLSEVKDFGEGCVRTRPEDLEVCLVIGDGNWQIKCPVLWIFSW